MKFIRNLFGKFKKKQEKAPEPTLAQKVAEAKRHRTIAAVSAPRYHHSSHVAPAVSQPSTTSSGPSALETYMLMSMLSSNSAPSHSSPAPAYEPPSSGGGSFDGGGASGNWDSSDSCSRSSYSSSSDSGSSYSSDSSSSSSDSCSSSSSSDY